MQGYDWGFGFGFGRRHPAQRSGYDAEMGVRGYDRGFGGGGRGGSRRPGRFGGGDYGRGVYGENYPRFGGVPGGRERGLYYGGAAEQGRGGYGGDFERGGGRGRPGAMYPRDQRSFAARGGYGREMQPRGGQGGFDRGYDRGYAEEPFLPESAYRRHPELAHPARHRLDRWPGGGYGAGPAHVLDDDELEQAVRQSLYQDNWIDADDIDVEVNGAIVTLRGEVGDFLQARYAWDDAWETEGVRGVINQLTVRTDQPAEPATPEEAEQ